MNSTLWQSLPNSSITVTTSEAAHPHVPSWCLQSETSSPPTFNASNPFCLPPGSASNQARDNGRPRAFGVSEEANWLRQNLHRYLEKCSSEHQHQICLEPAPALHLVHLQADLRSPDCASALPQSQSVSRPEKAQSHPPLSGTRRSLVPRCERDAAHDWWFPNREL
ncbi:uncharacterized protein BKA78DRAFT_159435 [Phyllosticta capitalensis]|uniref:uncharacterized protein n=1 Tax=Phyllosticta capitalensis TaxID=121624 RepID=UPI00312E8B4F